MHRRLRLTGLLTALMLVVLALPGSLAAARAPAADTVPSPRTAASDLLVSVMRTAMESTARAVPAPSSDAGVAAAPVADVGIDGVGTYRASGRTLDLGARLAAATRGLDLVRRQLAFESQHVLRGISGAIGARVDGIRRAGTTPVGLITIFVGLCAIVLVPALRSMTTRLGHHRAADARQSGAAVLSKAVRSADRIVDARHLVALGTPSSEVSARTGVSHDLIETMRALQTQGRGAIGCDLEAGASR